MVVVVVVVVVVVAVVVAMVLVAAVGGGGDGCSGGSVSQGVRSTTFALARACTDVHIHTRTHM